MFPARAASGTLDSMLLVPTEFGCVCAFRKHDDSGVGDVIPAAVRLCVEPDPTVKLDGIVAIHDHASEPRATPYDHVVHDDALVELDVLLEHDLSAQNRIVHRRAFDERARAQHAVAHAAVEDLRRRAL